MSAKKDNTVPAIRPQRSAESDREVSTIPTDTLSAIAEMISRHPDEMLRVIRRWMVDTDESQD